MNVVKIIKQHGVKIGLAIIALESIDHFFLPAFLFYIGWHKLAVIAAAVPWSEVIVSLSAGFVAVKNNLKNNKKNA